MKTLTEKTARKTLFTVLDPEMHISIMDLGLVYEVAVDGKNVTIKMTLTTLGCPLFPVIEKDVKDALYKVGAKDVEIELTFDPPWSFEKMTDRARAMLGL